MNRLPITWNGRLPGVTVQPAPPTSPETSLRLDVAGFVGFAERGPLDTPIMLEDMSQYRAVFGGDVFLSRLNGQPVYGHLSSAVQAFFDNGGRRCYVVRVAGSKAAANDFPLQGLFAWSPVENGAQTDSMQQVTCPAASVGRWSDGVRVATRLRIQPLLPERPWEGMDFHAERLGSVESAPIDTNSPALPLKPEDAGKGSKAVDLVEIGSDIGPPCYQVTIKVRAPGANSVQPGDLLEMHFADAQATRLYCRIKQVEAIGPATAEYSAMRTVQLNLTGDPAGTVAFATRRSLPPRADLIAVDWQMEGSPDEEWTAVRPAQLIKVEEPDAAADRQMYQVVLRDESGIPSVEADPAKPDETPKSILLRLVFARPGQEAGQDIRENQRDILIFRCADEINASQRARRLVADRFWYEREILNTLQVLGEEGWSPLATPLGGLTVVPGADDFPYQLHLPPRGTIPGPGSVLRLRFYSGRDYLFIVRSAEEGLLQDNRTAITLSTDALWEAVEPTSAVGQPVLANLLTFDLYIREGRTALESWSNLRFNPGERLPQDNRRGSHGAVNFWADVLSAPLSLPKVSFTAQEWLQKSTRLARPDVATELPLFLPLGMSDRLATDNRFQGRLTYVNAHDGLDRYNPVTMFLDPAFIQKSTQTERRRIFEPAEVRAQANDMLYLRLPSQRPTKLHSLYAVDEVALISIPDLGQRRFRCQARRIILPPPPVAVPSPDAFNPCAAPKLRSVPRWQRYQSITTEAIGEVDLFQRLAALPEMQPDWQPCESIDEVLMVHRAMINFAAARADVLAVLSLPLGYGVWDVIDWHERLTEGLVIQEYAPPPDSQEGWVRRFIVDDDQAGYGDNPALSYAAIWHGWVEVREEKTPQLLPTRAIPPDGAVCGMIAARELARGPGVAPANEALRGVVGLISPVNDAQWDLLFNRQVNVLHARPGKFLTMSAYTLSNDRQLLQISVRRMLIFLRKLVYREGMRYVFEPNNERFRRSVQTRFERMFDRLIQGGSLMAYSVDTGDSLNNFGEIDRGRFIIAIRVALTYPVEYITIVLLRTSETLLDVLER